MKKKILNLKHYASYLKPRVLDPLPALFLVEESRTIKI
jgi:hypothetical protein